MERANSSTGLEFRPNTQQQRRRGYLYEIWIMQLSQMRFKLKSGNARVAEEMFELIERRQTDPTEPRVRYNNGNVQSICNEGIALRPRDIKL